MADNETLDGKDTDGADEAEVGFTAKDSDLAAIFQEASDTSPIPASGEEEPKEAAAADSSPTEDPRISEILAKLEAQQDTITELTTKNTILQHQITQPREPTKTEEAQIRKGLMTREEFRAKAAAGNPIDAIYEALEGLNEAGKAQTQEAINQARAISGRDRALQSEFETDRQSALKEFGDLFDNNKEFAALAGQVYSTMTSDSPTYPNGMKWHKGAMYSAAAVAYAQLDKAGKLTTKPGNVVRLTERKAKPSNPILGSSGNAETKGIASEFDAKELAVQKRVATSMGLTLDRYHQIYADLKKRDKSYGG